MIDSIQEVVVLGASGTIGSLIGGILAQENLHVYFLSRTSEGAEKGLARAVKQARSEVIRKNFTCGSYDQLFEDALKQADWVLECVTEDIEIKRKLLTDVDRLRDTHTVVSSVTSSLPIDQLAEGMSPSFKEHFLSTHFYNPPGKMLACEICGASATNPQVVNFMANFIARKLRRVVIPVKNSVAFAGNRIAFLLFSHITTLVEKYGVELIDYVIGPYTGRLLAPLATLDLVGLDVHKAIIDNMARNTDDKMHDYLVVPDYIKTMINNGALGNKTKHGFYKKLETGKYSYIDPAACQYISAIEPHLVFVEEAKHFVHMGQYEAAFRVIRESRSVESQLVLNILCMYVSYAYSLIGKVTETKDGIHGIDNIMSYGFNWAPPSVVVEMLGGKNVVADMLSELGLDLPNCSSIVPASRSYILSSYKHFVAK